MWLHNPSLLNTKSLIPSVYVSLKEFYLTGCDIRDAIRPIVRDIKLLEKGIYVFDVMANGNRKIKGGIVGFPGDHVDQCVLMRHMGNNAADHAIV